MSLQLFDVSTAFAAFAAAGCRPPKAHDTDEGLDFALRVWCAALADLERVELLELVVAFIRSPGSKWWPTPGELLVLRSAGDGDEAVGQWGSLLVMLSAKGRGNPPTLRAKLDEAFEQWVADSARLTRLTIGPQPWALDVDEDIDRAIQAGLEAVGGWRLACRMQERDHVAHRAAFRDAYRAARRSRARGLERAAVGAIASGKLPSLLTGGE